MADWNRRVRRALRDELRPGEDVVTTVFLQPLGTMTTTAARGAGGAPRAAVAGGGATASRSGVGSVCLAASLPDDATVLAMTTQRLLALGLRSFGRRPKGIVATLAPNDLDAVEVTARRKHSKVELRFVDGSAAVYHAPGSAGGADGFAQHVNGR